MPVHLGYVLQPNNRAGLPLTRGAQRLTIGAVHRGQVFAARVLLGLPLAFLAGAGAARIVFWSATPDSPR